MARAIAEQAHRDVKCVQAYERVVRRPEKIGADRQAFVVNQVVPFAARAREKNGAQSHGHEPPRTKRADFRLAQSRARPDESSGCWRAGRSC